MRAQNGGALERLATRNKTWYCAPCLIHQNMLLRVILILVPAIYPTICIYLSPKLFVLERVPVCVIVHDMCCSVVG